MNQHGQNMCETSYHDQHAACPEWGTMHPGYKVRSKIRMKPHTMINMGNNRHVTDVMFVVHNSAELISCELHLQVSRIFLNSDHTKQTKGKFSSLTSKRALTILTSL